MSSSFQTARRLAARAVLAPVLAFAIWGLAMLPGQAQVESWTPTGFDEHSRAAWAALVDFCGPGMPERPSDEAIADLCAQSYEVSLVYLATLLAWSQLPSSEGGMIDMQVFPDIDADWRTRIAELAAQAEPPWTIEANPDIARAPASVRPLLIDTAIRSYDTMQRVAVARALIDEPQILTLDEPTATGDTSEGTAPAADDASAAVGADAVATPQSGPENTTDK